MLRSRPTERKKYSKTGSTHFCCLFWLQSVRHEPFRLTDDIRDQKWRLQSPRNFLSSPWILPERSIIVIYLIYSLCSKRSNSTRSHIVQSSQDNSLRRFTAVLFLLCLFTLKTLKSKIRLDWREVERSVVASFLDRRVSGFAPPDAR